MTDELRAFLIYSAVLAGASFVGGRMTAPVPPAEVRYVTLPAPVVEPEPAPVAPLEPPAAVVAAEPESVAPEVEAKPAPKPRPKVEAKPKEQPKPKPKASALKKSLPSCAVVKSQFQRMSYAQQMAAYARASSEEIAHGRRCLGM